MWTNGSVEHRDLSVLHRGFPSQAKASRALSLQMTPEIPRNSSTRLNRNRTAGREHSVSSAPQHRVPPDRPVTQKGRTRGKKGLRSSWCSCRCRREQFVRDRGGFLPYGECVVVFNFSLSSRSLAPASQAFLLCAWARLPVFAKR